MLMCSNSRNAAMSEKAQLMLLEYQFAGTMQEQPGSQMQDDNK